MDDLGLQQNLIADFSVAAATIRSDHSTFTSLANGALAGDAFVLNTTSNAADASDRIFYEVYTGNLFFDRYGTGSAVKIHFVTIGTDLALT